MNNLDIYNKASAVPENAKKPILAGRLKGMTDINPMWRIKMLTELFGMCGIGWKYTITDKRVVEGADGAICAFVDIDLFVKVDGEWSEAIQGTGGSQLVSIERNGLYTNDECFKMALTDALSVACKALGFGADIYWGSGRTKYDVTGDKAPANQTAARAFPEVVNIPTYEQALEMKHSGKTLRELYKEDIAGVRALYGAEGTPPELNEAIRVIEAEISKSRAK